MAIIAQLLQSNKNNNSVFSINDMLGLLETTNSGSIYSALKYAEKRGDIMRIARGLYAFSKNYSKQEFANKYRRPSYISLYTILQENGVVFQPYPSIYVVSNYPEEMEIDSQKYIYRKIKNEILLNPLGIITSNGISKATPERALCDKLYLDGDEYFDNLRSINWGLVKQLNEQVYNSNSSILKFLEKNSK